ncbi:MAG TPA: type II toxin-antitoxin system RelE/ParE family toxin [Candidatus Bathyarchaeia archaeon]|jgi:plasmid stabilization system protein ParE|nr:type II toxin-antitoxin system RelE/ParE family toxin [Candidatus Bathyarchaeia archaeon]
MRVRWTTPAREQFVSACEYIAADNRGAAAGTADKIWKSTQLLGRQPMAGRPGRVDGTRELVVVGAPFIVAYRVASNEVEILAVMHAARKWPDEF